MQAGCLPNCNFQIDWTRPTATTMQLRSKCQYACVLQT